MNRSRRFGLWISGILAVVCLLLLNILVGKFQKKPGLRLASVDPARSVSLGEQPPASSPENYGTRRTEAAVSSTAAAKSRLHPLARAARHPFESGQAKRLVSMPPAEVHLPAVVVPQPKTTTLEPLGYVEKADGRVEAIISLGDGVHVVHEGEILDGNFKVAKISSKAVELVENSAPMAQARLTAEVAQGAAQALADQAGQTNSPLVPEQVSNTGANLQLPAEPAASGSQPSVRKALGYVERANGRVEAIVADGEHVRLSQATRSFANEFHGPTDAPANVELANVSPTANNPPDSIVLESQPARTNSFTQQADEPPLVALQSGSSTVDEPQGVPAGNGEPESDPLGIIQPEPLADYSSSRFGANIPQAVMPTPPAVGDPLPSNAGWTQSVVSTLGYVEKGDGEKEAVVEVLGQVYLVHEGELFAEKYRALQVTSSSVQIVEESTEGSSPPEIERDSEAIPSPISRLRAPPLSMGSSGPDSPVEARKAEELAAGKLCCSSTRPSPEHLIELRQGTEGVKTPRTAIESVRPSERLAQADTRSRLFAPQTVGFGQKASGEAESIVAGEGGMYLVPGGRVSLDSPKIPRLFPAEPQSSRESIQGLLQGMPTTTFKLDAPPTRRTVDFEGVTQPGSNAVPSRCSPCPAALDSLASGRLPGTGVDASPKAVIPAPAGIPGAPLLSRGVRSAAPQP